MYSISTIMAFTTSSDGSSIYYEIEGTGTITLFFVYGAGCYIDYWQFQRVLSNRYRLVFCDLAGHGASQSNREKYTMEAFGQDVAAVIEHADLSNVILIGWSMGGPVILEAAMIKYRQVIGVIGVDSFFPWEGMPYTLATGEVLERWNQWLNQFRTDDKNVFYKAYVGFFDPMFQSGKPVDHSVKKNLLKLGEQMTSKVFAGEIEQLLHWDLFAIATLVKQPIKSIISGLSVSDPKLRPKFRKEENGYVDFNAIFMEDVSHVLMLQNPQEFNQIVDEMVASIVENR